MRYSGIAMRPTLRMNGWSETLLLALALLGGCTTLGYYGQAARGQLELLAARRPVAEVLADPAVPAEIRRKLALALAAREFASRTLRLPDNASYRSYADLQREYVVWNVFAAPPLSLEPVESCFPIAGCLAYRGYFSAAAAGAHAAGLREQGYDVFQGGVAAYSSLGWFDDPVLNTMLAWEDARIVKMIFHELAHQLLYVRDDTVFNESFATAVAEHGYRLWLAAGGGAGPAETLHERREAALIELLVAYRDRLQAVYAGAAPVPAKLAEKHALFAALAADYAALKARWRGDPHFDHWMLTDLNNAKLASIATYHDHVPAFMAILRAAHEDLAEFHARVRRLARLEQPARDACLRAVLADPPGCPLAMHRVFCDRGHENRCTN